MQSIAHFIQCMKRSWWNRLPLLYSCHLGLCLPSLHPSARVWQSNFCITNQPSFTNNSQIHQENWAQNKSWITKKWSELQKAQQYQLTWYHTNIWFKPKYPAFYIYPTQSNHNFLQYIKFVNHQDVQCPACFYVQIISSHRN